MDHSDTLEVGEDHIDTLVGLEEDHQQHPRDSFLLPQEAQKDPQDRDENHPRHHQVVAALDNVLHAPQEPTHRQQAMGLLPRRHPVTRDGWIILGEEEVYQPWSSWSKCSMANFTLILRRNSTILRELKSVSVPI